MTTILLLWASIEDPMLFTEPVLWGFLFLAMVLDCMLFCMMEE